MINVDDICMLYRRAHNDKDIISIICTVHSLQAKQVREILIENKLMTAEGEYNAPIRLTGREYIMAQWKWMPHRKKQFDQMKAEGKSLEQIAKALGCTLEIVTEYDNNPKPIKPHKKPATPKATAPVSTPLEVVSEAPSATEIKYVRWPSSCWHWSYWSIITRITFPAIIKAVPRFARLC